LLPATRDPNGGNRRHEGASVFNATLPRLRAISLFLPSAVISSLFRSKIDFEIGVIVNTGIAFVIFQVITDSVLSHKQLSNLAA